MIKIQSPKFVLVLTTALALCACGTAPVLLSKSAATPANVNLTGDWVLRDGPEALRLPRDGEQMEPIIPTTRSVRRSRRGDDVPVRVFLEYGENLKITQTQYGLFISYDRSVVDEYTFGENREIAVGPIDALRVSGWEGEAFTVETLDMSRNRLLEEWRLNTSDDGSSDRLIRLIRIMEKDKETFRIEQVFDRRD